ncbi:hypothetical protein C8P67_105163 [Flavobacterium aquicola]|uniref:Uncharacterized protein n=1 Tax=Flavobacterium aquicola TaxID=1682742 RepID=A0A3E0ELD5_9FLAO|nr:hypothetical protein C8P67_105163 [Flavobacterium aquicola]
MKEQHYKYLAITFFLIIIWILVGLFSSYDNQNSIFSTWSLYFYLGGSMMLGIALTIIVLALRLIFFKKEKFKNNLFYVFCGFLNMIICIIWFVTLLMKMISIDYKLTELGIPSFCLAIIILTDLYFPKSQ